MKCFAAGPAAVLGMMASDIVRKAAAGTPQQYISTMNIYIYTYILNGSVPDFYMQNYTANDVLPFISADGTCAD
jgi:hypothetical protein